MYALKLFWPLKDMFDKGEGILLKCLTFTLLYDIIKFVNKTKFRKKKIKEG